MHPGEYMSTHRNQSAKGSSSVVQLSCKSNKTHVACRSADGTTVFVVLTATLYPKDIWESEGGDGLDALLRQVAYGSPSVPRPQPNYDSLISNIGHEVWIGGGVMTFQFFLSVLSLLHVAMVDAVYIHGEEPTGYYWDIARKDPRVRVVYRTLTHVYGNSKPTAHRAHISDICRVDAVLKYGGIYIDDDAMFVRPLTRELRGYEAVASLDVVTSPGTQYPDTISNAVLIGKPGARFWRIFQESMKTYDESDYFWIGLRQPYKIKERHPDTLLVDSRLQVGRHGSPMAKMFD